MYVYAAALQWVQIKAVFSVSWRRSRSARPSANLLNHNPHLSSLIFTVPLSHSWICSDAAKFVGMQSFSSVSAVLIRFPLGSAAQWQPRLAPYLDLVNSGIPHLLFKIVYKQIDIFAGCSFVCVQVVVCSSLLLLFQHFISVSLHSLIWWNSFMCEVWIAAVL